MYVSTLFLVKIVGMSIIAGLLLMDFVRFLDECVGYGGEEEKLSFYDWSVDDVPKGVVYKWGKNK